ncbi:MAG: hypothetical protein U0T74_09355 [Chitinophagales bacterium]
MINPIRLCNNLFNEKSLSDANLRSFCEDHLIRLSNNNPGAIYSTLISETTNKYTAYYGKMTSQAVQLSIQESMTASMKDAKVLVEEKIRSFYGLALFKFGEGNPSFQMLYPLGLGEYMNAKIGDVNKLYERLVINATTLLNADFPAEVTALDNAVAAYLSARTAQENAFSLVDNLITGKNSDRLALTVQLTKNFLIVASNNISNPDQFNDFYDAAYLPISESSQSITEEGIITGKQIINIQPDGVVYTNQTMIELYNPGLTTLRYYFAPVPGVDPNESEPFVEVAANEQITKSATALGLSPDRQFFTVQNQQELTGSYKVIIKP